MTTKPDENAAPVDGDGYRQMVCPFCGHEAKTSCIGAVHCGPHKLQSGKYEPAIRMVEVRR